MLRYITSGESHGKCLTSVIEGIPANVDLNIDEINLELKRRQCGYGRGGRMKIESDCIDILSGVRGKKTLGGPIALQIKNKDYENWTDYMNPMDEIDRDIKKVNNVRPGHADLVGSLKYDFDDARNVLERSSARETASRVAVGAISKQVLKVFGIDFVSHV
ncbi:MAG: chorismate synthase, partial [Paraclostridium sp.]